MKAQFLTPVVTIFDEKGNLDREENKKVYDHLINNGIDGIVVMGSTGEFFNMTMDMQKELIDLAITHVNGRCRVLIGTSRMSTEETIELADYATKKGADGVMIISPYYFALSDESIEKFYGEVAENTNAKIYLYNFPDRTGYDLSPEVTLKLARKHSNIVGYKDTVISMAHTRNLLNVMKEEFPEFEIYSGYDENFIHNLTSGGVGCIGGLSNLVPNVCSDWARAYDNKDFAKMEEIQQYINKAMNMYDISVPFMPTMKRAMKLKGIIDNDNMTKPFITLNDEQETKLKGLMEKLGL